MAFLFCSFSLGLQGISLILWDVFLNLLRCLLSTTQRRLYYDHIYPWFKSRKVDANAKTEVEEAKRPLRPSSFEEARDFSSRSCAIRSPTPRQDFFFTSARSIAGSATPLNRSYLWTTSSGPASAMVVDDDSSSEDESSVQIPKPATQPKAIPCSAGYGAFLVTSLNLPSGTKALMQIFVGRKLLQEVGGSSTVYGQWLGWMMAAIYMGGRVPQIVLNIKRGSIEGLNPLMFIFALIANATYVGRSPLSLSHTRVLISLLTYPDGSYFVCNILVRSTEWSKIKANLPWLLDAVACVALDTFVPFL